jgi:hypothetical protein
MKHALERLRRNGLAECVALRTGEKKTLPAKAETATMNKDYTVVVVV